MSRSEESIKQFIEINRFFMTATELSKELNITHSKVTYICSQHGWKPVTVRERTEEYIKAHPDALQEDVAERLGVDITNLHIYMKDTGINLLTRYQKKMLDQKEKPKEEPVNNGSINNWPKEYLDYINAVTGYKPPGAKKIKRAKW